MKTRRRRKPFLTKRQSTAVLTFLVAICIAIQARQTQLGMSDALAGFTYVVMAGAVALLRIVTLETVEEAEQQPSDAQAQQLAQLRETVQVQREAIARLMNKPAETPPTARFGAGEEGT